MEEHNTQEEKTNIPQMIIGAIVLVIIIGGLIALSALGTPNENQEQQEEEAPAGEEYDLAAVEYVPGDPDAHVRGALNPEVVVIEYSDFECPFCGRFHPTVQRLVNEYSDEVQWEYRHLPLTSIHPQAMPAAVASECVADIAGNEAFWQFADALFADQENLSRSFYIDTAVSIGISEDEFTTCLDADDRSAVTADLEEARAAGGAGTPFSVIIGPDGERRPFIGARPYSELESIVTSMLAS